MGKLLLCILITICFISFYIVRRNFKVYSFLTRINETIHKNIVTRLHSYKSSEEFNKDYNNFQQYYNLMNKLRNKYEYDKLLFSFKSLKLENWYTEEEIKMLFNESLYSNNRHNYWNISTRYD